MKVSMNAFTSLQPILPSEQNEKKKNKSLAVVISLALS